MCTYGRIGTYDEITESNNKIIVIRHRLGLKGSKFLLGFLKSLFTNMLGMIAKYKLPIIQLKSNYNLKTNEKMRFILYFSINS